MDKRELKVEERQRQRKMGGRGGADEAQQNNRQPEPKPEPEKQTRALGPRRRSGQVLWFDPGKGYGFIKPVSANTSSAAVS